MREEENTLYRCVWNKLQQHDQQQLLDWYPSLNENEKKSLLLQLDEIDYKGLEQALHEEKKHGKNDLIKPMDVLKLGEIKKNKESFCALGRKEIEKGHVAVVLLAGGQATRLGSDSPKGMLDIGVTRPLYLFEIIVAKLKKTAEEAGRYIDLYIMVNSKNARETKNFFKGHNYFGYNRKHIIFFQQKMYPKVLFNGKLVLEQKSSVAMAPGGNGAWFEALQENCLVDKMKRDNIKWINLLSVDNPLYDIIDISFLGALIKQNGQLGVQVVEKNNPYEKVGVICKRKGRPYVREYYEMTKEELEAVNEKNELCFRYGVILNYMFKLSEMDKIKGSALPVHLAVKKIPFMNGDGKRVVPEKENGYIVERLALDMIHLFNHVLAYEVDRKRNFAPIKNRDGEDSIESARELLKYNGYEL